LYPDSIARTEHLSELTSIGIGIGQYVEEEGAYIAY